MTNFSNPGLYKMRNGERAEVFAERDGYLFGCVTANLGTMRWSADGGETNVWNSPFSLISPWTEERKPFECWVNRYSSPCYPGRMLFATHENQKEADDHAAPDRIGPAIRIIEASPLTDAAPDMYEALKLLVLAYESDEGTEHDEALLEEAHQRSVAALAKAKP